MDKLLPERISLAGIAGVTGVSEQWLQNDVNAKYRQVPRQVVFKKRVSGVSSSSVMSEGLLLKRAIINSGFG